MPPRRPLAPVPRSPIPASAPLPLVLFARRLDAPPGGTWRPTSLNFAAIVTQPLTVPRSWRRQCHRSCHVPALLLRHIFGLHAQHPSPPFSAIIYNSPSPPFSSSLGDVLLTPFILPFPSPALTSSFLPSYINNTQGSYTSSGTSTWPPFGLINNSILGELQVLRGDVPVPRHFGGYENVLNN